MSLRPKPLSRTCKKVAHNHQGKQEDLDDRIFEFTFILIFYSMLRDCETGGQFDTPFNAMMSIFAISMGELNLPIIDTATFDDDDSNCSRNKEYIASLLVLVLVFILTICYLNLLIAMMTQSYTDAHRESTQLATRSIL